MAAWGEPARRWICRGAEAAVAWLCLALAAPSVTAALPRNETAAVAMPRISVHGSRLYAGARLWRAWGMNWGVGDRVPVDTYFDDPTAAHFAALSAELRTARGLGANSMRIYLQLGQVMATPIHTRQQTLSALKRLLALAQSDGIYLDVTGDLVWQPARAPGWYGRMRRHARWQVQARFWKAVAHAASSSPAVLCYELTSEPLVSQTPGYYYGHLGNWWFRQSIATEPVRRANAAARSWTRLLASAVHTQDGRPVSIGLLPLTTGPFAPANIADLLDMLVVHEYPTTGEAAVATSLVHTFAAARKPVLLGETFIFTDDLATQRAFLVGAAPDLSGTFEFFDGHDPRTMKVQSIRDAVYKATLQQFIALRQTLLAG